MAPRNFGVNLSQEIYQAAVQRAQREGKSLEMILTDFVNQYGGQNGGQQTTYVVRSGDTLSKIARQFYGDPYKYTLIQQANHIDNAGQIWVGQVLVIPALAGGSVTPTPQPPSTPAPGTPSPEPKPAPVEPKPTPTPPTAPTGPVNPSFLNGNFETFQPRLSDGKPSFWREFPEEYGQYWSYKLISESKKNRLRLMSSPVFGQFAQRYFGGGGLNYAYGGGNSQVVTSRYGFDIVFWQTVAAQPGRNYTFTGLLVSFFKGTDNPATSGKIFKTLGIDPTGGTDYRSPGLVWGERTDKDHAWLNPAIQSTAQAGAITVFIRLESVEKDVGETELNIVHLDRFELK